MPWQSSADQTEKKHEDIFSRAREGEAACKRDTGIKNHTVVLEVVVLKAPADHAVAELQRQNTVLRVSATRCCELPDRGVREHLPRTDDHAVAQYFVVVLEVPGRPRSGKLPQSGTGGRETDRKAAFSKSVTLLSLIERVMSNLTGVELVQCSEVVLQDNDQSSRALETTPHNRRARRVCVSGAGAPAVRPQHVEVRVEEKQKIHDVRKTRIHEYSQPEGTRATVNDAVKASSQPWSTRHGSRSCIGR